MAQECLLRTRYQEAHDVVADAGEPLHLGLGEVGRRDALEALPVGLLTGHVVAPALGGGVHEDELLVVHGDEADAARAVRPALLQDLDAPVPQVRADCLVRPLVDALSHGCLPPRVGARPLGAPRGADGACGEASAQGGKRNADAPEFSEWRPVLFGKVFAALARKRPWASLRSQGETGWGVLAEAARGNAAMEFAVRCCASVRWGHALVEARCAGWLLVGLAGRRGARLDAVRCAMAMPVKRPGASCRRGVPVGMRGGLSVRYGIVPGDGLRRLLCYHVDCSDGRLA